MLKQFYFFCFLIGMTHLSQAQHLQLMENRGEIGLFAGQSSYRGDIAPDNFKFYNSYGAFYKKNFNDYGGLRLNYEKIRIGSEDSLSMNPYAIKRNFFFSRDFHDISLLGEFNFTRFLPGNKSYRFTPYLGIGVGYLFAIGKDSVTKALDDSISIKKQYLYFPIQLGFKFNLTKRVNLFAEVMYRFTNNDELDYLVDGKLVNNYQGSRSGKDQFFSVKGGISYNLIKIYGEEKWKPGKRSLMNRLKGEETGQDKPGFFSRLKFKRK
jgi:opacity protein-like surface antigen